jgi:hypothetical protein
MARYGSSLFFEYRPGTLAWELRKNPPKEAKNYLLSYAPISVADPGSGALLTRDTE